ncbi:MAG: glycosyltransferase [Oscillospiraceae bacterium]|nr:glycosyltransferase [Oscillospiraceae bacterium]
MKLLILTAATGGGHVRASRAIQAYISKHPSESIDEVVVVDALKSISSILDKTVCDGYHFLATKTPKVFGQLYRRTNVNSVLSTLVSRFSSVFSIKLISLLEEQKPDVILSTHPFATEMISHLKRAGVVTAPLICLMTDYGPHRAWIADKVDAYVVSNGDMISEMEAMGVPKEKIYPFGIPVGDVFFSAEDSPAFLKRIGQDPSLPTILIMAGSFGVTNILKIYRQIVQLDLKFQINVITGRNEKLYEEFAKLVPGSPKPTKLVFFTNEVENYMHAADLLITKPGGLTVSEALACGIPLAVFDAIPGQEEDNANFLLTHNMAVKLENGADCGETIRSLLENSQKLNAMRSSCKGFDKSRSAENIIRLIQNLYQQSQSQNS